MFITHTHTGYARLNKTEREVPVVCAYVSVWMWVCFMCPACFAVRIGMYQQVLCGCTCLDLLPSLYVCFEFKAKICNKFEFNCLIVSANYVDN